jgi:hypothetical protein
MLLVSIVIVSSFSFVKCGADGGIFLPDLSRDWINAADANNRFFFFDFPVDKNSGNFEGNEFNANSQTGHFSGNFNNHDLQFVYDNSSGTKSGQKYTGTIDNSSTNMTLNTPSGKINLTKK